MLLPVPEDIARVALLLPDNACDERCRGSHHPPVLEVGGAVIRQTRARRRRDGK